MQELKIGMRVTYNGKKAFVVGFPGDKVTILQEKTHHFVRKEDLKPYNEK